ncbi:hypothetical protein [Armatimonas sp.]|uniref:hypothetical protein n=1 Tax=Armatimonas sp. TaxID=1872638 RepID=UPI003752667E
METTESKKTKKFTIYTAEAVLLRAELAITGTQSDPEILALVAAFGYDSAAFTAAQVQLDGVQAFIITVQQARAAQKQATQDVTIVFSTARLACSDLATVAREALKGDGAALTSLGLSKGNQPQALAAFLLYADKLFAGALAAPDDVKAALAAKGYTAAKLTAEKAKVTALHAANQAQEQAKGTSQNLTPQQQTLLSELDDWTMTYRKLARRALRTSPQLLEKLGIKA